MIILSDCLTKKADEGCLNVANSLTKKIKAADPDVVVISYGERGGEADEHLHLNKLFLNVRLLSQVRADDDPVLYIPFSSNTTASALRTLTLSLASRRRVRVLFALCHPMKRLERMFLQLGKAQIIALSQESASYYASMTGNPVHYLKTGIDTKRFVPADAAKKAALRKKYGIGPEETVVLHVGHLKSGRNVGTLLHIGEHFRIVLVISSATKADESLKKQLLSRGNITIIDDWLEHVEEVYQMADVYYFPVQERENCIDTPLSVLEAASCNLPVVTTAYGELKNFKGETGFCFLSSLEPEPLNRALERMLSYRGNTNREAVLPYDWERAVAFLTGRKEKKNEEV